MPGLTGHHHGGHDGDLPEVMDAAYWDERYRTRTMLWSGRPNPNLVAQAADLPPGRALDVGCGEGGDAIWLAERGWEVTAVDISAVALTRAAGQAAGAAPGASRRIDWLEADLLAWNPPAAHYDLVSAQYFHLPTAQRDVCFGKLARSVAPGGSLLIVGHHPSDLETTAARPRTVDLFFTGDDIAALLSPREWRIEANVAPGREATDPGGQTISIHDTVLRAERLA
jgi:SAM-dependent methyltransferase